MAVTHRAQKNLSGTKHSGGQKDLGSSSSLIASVVKIVVIAHLITTGNLLDIQDLAFGKQRYFRIGFVKNLFEQCFVQGVASLRDAPQHAAPLPFAVRMVDERVAASPICRSVRIIFVDGEF